MSAIKVIFAIALAAILPAAKADTFLLADGSTCQGTAVEDGEQVTITTFDGRTIKVPKKNIKGVVSDPKRNQFQPRRKALLENDVAGRFDLAQWAGENGLKAEASALYLEVLKLDPRHDGAGKALGYEFRDGAWQPGAEDIRIAGRPESPKVDAAKPRVVSADELRDLSKRLEKYVVDAGPQLPEAAGLEEEARQQPEVFAKLLIPPQLPGYVYGAKPEVRIRAARLLGIAQDRRAMQSLVDASVYDADEKVRFAAAKALPLLQEPVALRKLTDIAVFGDPRHYPWALRQRAAQALRRYGDKEGLERLLRELSFELAAGNPLDPKNRPRGKGSGIGTENPLGIPDSPPDLGLAEQDLYPVLSAVKEVTGQSFDNGEKDMKTWRAWWRQNGEKFTFKD